MREGEQEKGSEITCAHVIIAVLSFTSQEKVAKGCEIVKIYGRIERERERERRVEGEGSEERKS